MGNQDLPISVMKEGVEDAGEERHQRCIRGLKYISKENAEKLDASRRGLKDGVETYSRLAAEEEKDNGDVSMVQGFDEEESRGRKKKGKERYYNIINYNLKIIYIYVKKF